MGNGSVGICLRKALSFSSKGPSWLNLPAMMRMGVTTPNVLKHRRPEWLGPFNFFLFPLVSEQFGGFPAEFDKSNFLFITPMEPDRRQWRTLVGTNLIDRQTYQMSMAPSERQDKVIPDSLRIILNQYLKKEEAKSLGPDGSPCTEATRGLLQRARIIASKISPVHKETDRKWEHGEDPSMLEPGLHVLESQKKMSVADPSDRKRWSEIGVRRLMRESGSVKRPSTRF